MGEGWRSGEEVEGWTDNNNLLAFHLMASSVISSILIIIISFDYISLLSECLTDTNDEMNNLNLDLKLYFHPSTFSLKVSHAWNGSWAKLVETVLSALSAAGDNM